MENPKNEGLKGLNESPEARANEEVSPPAENGGAQPEGQPPKKTQKRRRYRRPRSGQKKAGGVAEQQEAHPEPSPVQEPKQELKPEAEQQAPAEQTGGQPEGNGAQPKPNGGKPRSRNRRRRSRKPASPAQIETQDVAEAPATERQAGAEVAPPERGEEPDAAEEAGQIEAPATEPEPAVQPEPGAKPRRRRTKKPAAERKSPQAAPKDERSPMNREILVSAAKDETRVALVENGAVVEFYVERPSSQKIAGSIFLGKATNVLPGMQAAFIDIGEEKNAFLYVDDAILPPNLEDTDAAPELKSHRKRTITELVKPGQDIMVQVVKEAIGTKGARVTRHVTFPGRYLVLMPTVSYVGVSRRIGDDEERKRLRQIAREIKPQDMGVIIRTVAENKSKEDLQKDLDFLVRIWEKVQRRAKSVKSPSQIHSDLGLVFRVVRDEFNQDTTRMLVDDVDTYSRTLDLLDSVAPEMKERVIYYRDREYPLFQLYGVDAAIEKALGRQVWLKSGGYIVIDKTEALTVIDVNTGRYVGTKNLADTVFKINIEACEEIARQLRLRDIGGIIVVDFIDMDIPEHRAKLLQEMEKQLRHDHTKTVVVGLTGLGLVEMTRKKVRQSIDAVMMRMCPYCGGKGVVMSEETVAGRVRREIRRILRNSQSEAMLVEVHPGVASYLIGPGGANLKDLEKETNRSIFVRGTETLHLEEMNVKAVGTKDEIAQKAIPVQPGDVIEVTIEEAHDKNPGDGIARREGFVIDVEGGGGKVGQKVVVQVMQSHRTYARAKMVEAQVRDRVS